MVIWSAASILLVLAAMLSGCASESGPAAMPGSHGVGNMAAGPALQEPGSLPPFARPRGQILSSADYNGSDVIHYRVLKRSDFKGVNPPPDMAPYRDRLGAATCAYIVTTAETHIFVRPVHTSDGLLRYEAIPGGLGFRAEMDRSCSWWNTEQQRLRTDYVLEHEQIHFALFEIEARRLNAAVDRISRSLKTTASTPEEARRGLQSRLEQVLGKSLESVLARSQEFDEQTSMGYRPEKQKAWLRRVRSDLSGTQLAF